MAIAKKPAKKPTPITSKETAKVKQFIQGAPDHTAGNGGERELAQVIIRVDKLLLARIDATARDLGFTQRAPFILSTLVDRVRRFENEHQ
jgi:hypothetical protein